MMDFEDFMLARENLLRLSKAELDAQPLSTIQHWVGFAQGLHELNVQKQKEADKQQQFDRFRRGK